MYSERRLGNVTMSGILEQLRPTHMAEVSAKTIQVGQ